MLRFLFFIVPIGACTANDDTGADGSLDTDTDSDTERTEDKDLDGYDADVDCNDLNAGIHPGASEACNGIDDNCDGEVDEGVTIDLYPDSDGDGFGPGNPTPSCVEVEGRVSQGGDCDDDNAAINPDAVEVCDSIGTDEDCDGLINEEDPSLELTTWYLDSDGDGYGDDADIGTLSCNPVAGSVGNNLDCDDDDLGIHPDADEICDPANVDEDCDGGANDLDPEGAVDGLPYFADTDGDGYGDESSVYTYCDTPPVSAIDIGGDCDDSDAAIHPGASEECTDGIDNNCSGVADDCGPLDPIDLSDADTIIDGGAEGDVLGAALAHGDLDSNGIGDLIVSSTTAESGSGRVYLFGDPLGATELSAAATSTDYPASITGESTGLALGNHASIGDIDGDGNDDLLVSADTYPSLAWVFYGPLSGDITTADADVDIEGGQRIYTVGLVDTDSDGAAEMMVGEPARDEPLSNCGTLWVLESGASGTVELASSASVVEWNGSGSDHYLGFSSAALGDFDGDGLDDYASGAYGIDELGTYTGGAHVFLGSSTGGDADTDGHAGWVGPDEGAYAGWELNSASDHDGDGLDDLWVGAHGADYTSGDDGAAYLVLGSAVSTSMAALVGSAHAVVYGHEYGAAVGYHLDGTGDVNGDGSPDLLTGGPTLSSFPAGSRYEAGAAYVIYGPLSGASDVSDARRVLEGTNAGDRSGDRVTFLPDRDADGRDEVAVSVPGSDRAATDAGAVMLFGGARF